MSKPSVTYFNGRGRGETIRLTLAAAKVDFGDVRFEDITELKKTGKLPFGQVPLYEEGNLVLAQSATIVRHLGRKHGFYGSNDTEAALIDMIYDGGDDYYLSRYAAKTDEQKATFNTEMRPKWLAYFEALIKRNNNGSGFFVGNKLSIADICLFYVLEAENTDAFPCLKAFRERVAAVPGIADWLKRRPQTAW